MSATVVLRTGRPWEFDMAVHALKDAHLPFYTKLECIGGINFSVPAMLTPSPGTWFTILTPAPAVDDVKEILSELPFPVRTDPEAWDFAPTISTRNRFWVILAFYFPFFILFGTISIGLVKWIWNLFS